MFREKQGTAISFNLPEDDKSRINWLIDELTMEEYKNKNRLDKLLEFLDDKFWKNIRKV